MVDKFRDLLSRRRGSKPDSKISPAAVNKHLRSLRVALRKAHDWAYIAKLPKIEFAREADKLVVAIEAEHFDAIYKACDVAKHPRGRAYSSGQWWQPTHALLDVQPQATRVLDHAAACLQHRLLESTQVPAAAQRIFKLIA